jgi:hypothetical protein
VEKLNTHEAEIREMVLSLEPTAPPEPWRQHAFIAAGGVVAAGWTDDEKILLVSHDGYSLNATDGQRVERVRDSAGFFPSSLSFAVPSQAKPVRVFGIHGGDGLWVTSDGWSLEVVYPLWPRAWLLMRAPPTQPGTPGYLGGATRLDLQGLDEHDWLKVGFSASGQHLLAASASGCLILSRSSAS